MSYWSEYTSDNEKLKFNILVGKTFVSVNNNQDNIEFIVDENETYRQVYNPDCCAQCSVEEIHGDLSDLVGSPILQAEEVHSSKPPSVFFPSGGSETWTFYKLSTIKGSVTIRWYGESNGYYSETPSFETFINHEDY